MLRRFLVVLSFLGTSCLADSPDPIKATFGGGVLGIPWGTSLTSVIATYPQGDHVFAVTPGCRAYWVKEGQEVLGIPREGKGSLFGFDKQNHVVIAAVAFDFSRKEELRSTLILLLGAPAAARQTSDRTLYGWRSLDGMTVSVRELGEGSQRIVWLTVSVPGYKALKDQC